MPKSVSGARFARTISREPSLLLTNSTIYYYITIYFYRSDGVAINTLSAAKGYNMVVSGDITKQLMAKILNPKVLFYGNRGE